MTEAATGTTRSVGQIATMGAALVAWAGVIGRAARDAAGRPIGLLPGAVHSLWIGTVVILLARLTGLFQP